jgi:hypothetical protein
MGFETAGTRDVLNHYGARNTDESRGGALSTGTRSKQLVYKVSYDDLPGGTTDNIKLYIPAGSYITDVHLRATTNFAGGTSYDIGLEESDGSTAIDADGLFDALVLADIDATPGSSVSAAEHAGTNSGVLIGQELLVDGYLVMAATGTFTAGVMEIVVSYMKNGS